jgi:dTMP kinase
LGKQHFFLCNEKYSFKKSNSMTTIQGRLIVFEGAEGAGKSTQIQALQNWLEHSGWIQHRQAQLSSQVPSLLVTHEPGGTALGQQIRQLLLNHPKHSEQLENQVQVTALTELLLYAADRAQHVATCLQPSLRQGSLILCDRYTDSTMAYQGYGRNLPHSVIEQLNQIATEGLTSDLTLWLDVDPEVGLNRARSRQQPLDRMEAAGLAFHQSVRQGFMELAEKFPARIVRIDANQSEVEVTQQIQTVVQSYLQKWYPNLLPISSDNLKPSNS